MNQSLWVAAQFLNQKQLYFRKTYIFISINYKMSLVSFIIFFLNPVFSFHFGMWNCSCSQIHPLRRSVNLNSWEGPALCSAISGALHLSSAQPHPSSRFGSTWSKEPVLINPFTVSCLKWYGKSYQHTHFDFICRAVLQPELSTNWDCFYTQ